MNLEKKRSVIIVAGGKGLRVGGELPKQFQCIGGEPMLMHAIRAFFRYDSQMRIIVVLPEGMQAVWSQLCDDCCFSVDHIVVVGGETRFHSVKNGLEEVQEDEIVGIHDAARPFVTHELIDRCFSIADRNQCGVIPVIDEVNSVRLLTETGSEIIDRQRLKLVQTPQVFHSGDLKRAYDVDFDPSFTDDASVAERSGIRIQLVEGEEINAKITTSFDLAFANYYYRSVANR